MLRRHRREEREVFALSALYVSLAAIGGLLAVTRSARRAPQGAHAPLRTPDRPYRRRADRAGHLRVTRPGRSWRRDADHRGRGPRHARRRPRRSGLTPAYGLRELQLAPPRCPAWDRDASHVGRLGTPCVSHPGAALLGFGPDRGHHHPNGPSGGELYSRWRGGRTRNLPAPLRCAISAESGFNDGLALPFVVLPVFVLTEPSREVLGRC